jgi:hypothetical protein
MALVSLASKAGFAVEDVNGIANVIIDSNGNVITPDLTVNGLSHLGNIGNVKITGGTGGYVMTTDGAGNLTWTAAGSPTIIQHGDSNVTIPDLNGNVYINSNSAVDSQWVFDTTGNSTAPGDTSTLTLTARNGDTALSYTKPQISFGYNNTNLYPQWIHTRHQNIGAGNNAIDFYTNDSTAEAAFPTNAVLGLTINNGKVGIGNMPYPANVLDVGGNVYSNATITGDSFTAGSGTVDFNTNAPNVQLGNVANVHINGGSSGYVLTTDGAGNLSWATSGGGGGDGQMPYYIPSGETYTIQLYRQGLFRLPITIDGDLVVNGILVQV